MSKKITKDTTLAEILECSEVEEILVKYKLPCLYCPMAKFEAQNLTLGKICKMYGIEIEKLVEELNQKIEKVEKNTMRSRGHGL